MKGVITVTVGLVLGVAIGAGAMFWLSPGATSASAQGEGEPQPLYWVAPMDPNYRRDQPGKSPMGMDLIPVYEEGQSGGPDEGPGTISISPEVVNNLGVRTAQVSEQPMTVDIRTVGYVQYDQDQIVHLHPRVEGWVEKIYVQAAGEAVEKGQPLYELYSPELVNAQEELVFALSRGDRRLSQAAESRLRSLNVSDRTIARLKSERRSRQTVTFYAPASGVVDDFTLREGLFIKPGMTLMSIGGLDEVWVEAEVFERQAALVSTGLPVTMTLDYLPGEEWEGTVDYVYPTLDPKTRTLRVRMRFPNPEGALKPNMFAAVAIHAGSDEPVLSIPREALIPGFRSDRAVLALGDGHFKSVNVRTGQRSEDRIEVLEGLSAGEEVVTSAQFLLDSESSKTSDFRRMHVAEESGEAGEPATRVWVEATIHSVSDDGATVNVEHPPIPEWNWPAMRMDLPLYEFADASGIEPGSRGHIEIEKLEAGGYQIRDLYADDASAPMDHSGHNMEGMNHSGMDHSSMGEGSMDHSTMNHDAMNHEGMNQGGMDHSGMDHGAMDHSTMDHSSMGHDSMSGQGKEAP